MAQHSTDKDQVWLEPGPRQRPRPRRTLDWKVFWRLIHTKKLWYGPKDVDVRAFFYTFHALGSIVSSSCLCESAGSLLKHFSRGNPDTKRIVERTILRLAAVSGDGTDDAIILRTWLETVASPDKLNFIGSSMKAYNKNLERWPLGQGSKTIHSMRKAALNKKGSKMQWTVKRVKKIPRVAAKVLQIARLKASLHRWARAAAGDKQQQPPAASSACAGQFEMGGLSWDMEGVWKGSDMLSVIFCRLVARADLPSLSDIAMTRHAPEPLVRAMPLRLLVVSVLAGLVGSSLFSHALPALQQSDCRTAADGVCDGASLLQVNRAASPEHGSDRSLKRGETDQQRALPCLGG
eukprot:s78_g16.t1